MRVDFLANCPDRLGNWTIRQQTNSLSGPGQLADLTNCRSAFCGKFGQNSFFV